MQRRSRFARLVIGPLAVALVSALSVGACSNQGEGERCDNRGDHAGDDECQDGLKCLLVGSSSIPTENYRCCPADQTAPTVAACKVGQPPVPVREAGLPPADASADTGNVEASTDSSASDASTTTDAPTATDAGDSGG